MTKWPRVIPGGRVPACRDGTGTRLPRRLAVPGWCKGIWGKRTMTKHSIFDAWAPPSAIWSRWAKPVLFSQLDSIARDEKVAPELPVDVSWAVDSDHATAMVVD